MRKILLSLILISYNFSPAKAAIVINEVSPASTPEWVEIYNTSSSSASLKDYSIDFGNDNQKKYFCDNDYIPELGYKLITTTGYLNNDGDTVNLRLGDDLLDSISYGSGKPLPKLSASESISRSPDGNNNWVKLTSPTQQGIAVSFDCPPSPSPSPSPTPTPTPSPSLTPSPSPTPSPTPTPKPSVKPSPSVLPSLEEVASVAGATTEIDLSAFGVSPSPQNSPPGSLSGDSRKVPELNKSRAKTALLVGSGLLLLSLAGYLGYRKYQNSTIISE